MPTGEAAASDDTPQRHGPTDPGAGGTGRLIVCLGPTPTLQRTMTFDAIDAGELNRTAAVHDCASGKGINVARVLHTLGCEALYIGPVGGVRGDLIRDDLGRAGIPCDLVDVKAATRLCVTVVDRGRRQATELIEEPAALDPGVAEALLSRLAAVLDRAAVVVFSGSLAAGLPEDFYGRAVAMAREAGVRTIVDARGASLREALPARPDVVKPNRAELAATVGRDVSSRNAMHEAMRAIVAQGAGHVVITRGRDGSSASNGPRCWEIGTPKTTVVSPIGSGDAYAAGLAVGLRDGRDLPDACRYAGACGASNTESPYAGHVDAFRVAELTGQVVVRETG